MQGKWKKIHNCWVSSCIHCQCQMSVCANSYCGCELESDGQTTPWQHFHLKNEMVRCEFEVGINKTRTIAKTLHSPILCLRCVKWRAQDGMASYVTMPFTGKVNNLIKNVKICQNILGERKSKSVKHTVTPFYVSFASKGGQQPVVVHHWLLNGGNQNHLQAAHLNNWWWQSNGWGENWTQKCNISSFLVFFLWVGGDIGALTMCLWGGGQGQVWVTGGSTKTKKSKQLLKNARTNHL